MELNNPSTWQEVVRVPMADGTTLPLILGYVAETDRKRAVLIFPPHPALGGDTENNVVSALFEQAASRGCMAATFEYRGVEEGKVGSESVLSYWERLDEARDYAAILADCRALLSTLRHILAPGAALAFAAYSFGTVLAADLACELPGVRVCSISPPILEHDLGAVFTVLTNLLVIHGEDDIFCPSDAIRSLAESAGCDTLCVACPDHFFRGQEQELAALALDHLLAHEDSA